MPHRAAVLVLAVAASSCATLGRPQLVVPIEADRDQVVGFLPPMSDAPDGHGASEAHAHLAFALQDVAACLADRAVVVRGVTATAFVLRSGRGQHWLRLPRDWPSSVGAILVRPGREPRVVSATGGPTSLQRLLPEAVAEDFDAPQCRKEP